MKKNPKVARHGQNRSKFDLLNPFCGVSAIFIDIQLFYFLARIIPEKTSLYRI
jgi:hypothetical protein